ncbi:MAG TPA: ATP-binding protein [Burkholderiales bacterium]|nr:ATP-binding protein [Burkholderiales bacterium]
MKIRTQLVILVVAVLAPVTLLAALTIEQLWKLQRHAYQQQFLERVSALRLAQDTEMDSTRRTLRTLANAPDIDRRLPAFVERFPRLLTGNPMWSTIGLMTPAGKSIARVDRYPLPADALPDAATRDAVIAAKDVVISDLITGADGETHVTYLAAPVIRDGRVRSMLYIGIGGSGWLAFLQRYPVSENATLTLNDRNGRIIARTLNHDRWVGKTSGPSFWNRTIDKTEGSFLSAGLEGQSFYSAFSRSLESGWVVGTGVPQKEVEAALRGSTIAMIAGVVAAALLVVLFALLIGRRIAGALTSLAEAARAAATHELVPGTQLAIEEAETVRRTLEESSRRLREREKSLSDALRSEERASKAKDEFLAMLGHELRNPLSSITSASDLLQLNPKPDVAQRAQEILHRQARHLAGMVDDMLDVARLTSGKVMLNRQIIDLEVAATHVLESFSDSGRCGHVRVEPRLASALVFADETRLEQVIANLLDNACKYTPAGGKVVLEVGTHDGDSVLRIRDTGSGIAPDLLPHVFDIFSQGARTLDRSQGGLGLGLTVVRRLVELHGGTVSVTSAGPDRGSTFVLRLPRATESAVALREPSSAAVHAPQPRRILLIEDSRDNRESVAALLRLKGHQVLVAEDGLRGLAALESAQPEIALVDLGLPGLDGLEIARRVRGEPGPRPCLIALTGYGSDADRRQAEAAGFDAFLVKPFDMAKFEAAARAAESKLAADPAIQRVRPSAA